MKTKTNLFLRFGLKFLFIFFVGFFTSQTFANLSATNSVIPLTSGLRFQYYDVVWCSPHAGRLSDTRFTSTQLCKTGRFQQKETGKGIMTYKGENFYNGNVKMKSDVDSILTVSGGTRVSTYNLIDFFNVNEVQFEGEGTYTIRIILVDYAYNASKFEFTYKIDKTAPQFTLNGILDYTSDKTIFIPTVDPEKRLTDLTGAILRYDSSLSVVPHPDKYNNSDPSDYTGSVARITSGNTRTNLYPIYFRDTLLTNRFRLDTEYDDTYTGWMRGGTNYLAGVSMFELLDANSVSIKKFTTINLPGSQYTNLNQNIDLLTSYLTGNSLLRNDLENSQKKYKLRLYDRSIGKDVDKISNYSEIIFYAVRDNTVPNMGGNGLALTKSNAIKRIIEFDNSTTTDITAWDENILPVAYEASGYSKFIAAKTDQALYSNVSDIGITGDHIITGNNTKYGWYNAGIDFSKITIKIQNHQDTGLISYTPLTERFNNVNKAFPLVHNFQNVDLNRQNGYRNYPTEYESQDSYVGICDNVGNCLTPKLDFRVVAAVLDNTKSTLSLSAPTLNKAFANGKDEYEIKAEFKDIYGNNIVGVTAAENGNRKPKIVDTFFDFDNGLYADQHSDNVSGTKLAIVRDTQSDNKTSETLTGTINNAANDESVFFEELPETTLDTNRGIYSFKLASKVPTAGLYPYLKEDSKLKLTQIRPKTTIDKTGVGVFPTNNDVLALGSFDKQTTTTDIKLLGTTVNNFFTSNSLFVKSTTDYKNDFNELQKTNYGVISSPSTNVTFNTLSTRVLDLEYASPLVYGGSGLTLSHLINNIGATQNHTKVTYKIGLDTSVIDNVNLHEKYLSSYALSGSSDDKKFTPGIFNIYSGLSTLTDAAFDSRIINNGTTINNIIGSVDTEKIIDYKTKSSPIDSNYHTAGYGFNMGYVSYLSYEIDGTIIQIPSISRNVSNNTSHSSTTVKDGSRFFFPTSSDDINTDGAGASYVILGDPIISAGIVGSMGIGITGLSSKEDMMLIDKKAGTKANLNVGENLTRYDLMSIFKQNVVKNSAGFDPINGKKWCSGLTIGTSELNSPLPTSTIADCTVKIGGELISFVKGNVEIDCGSDCILSNNIKRTIIVKDGSTYIKSNISKFGTNSQFLIGTIVDGGLQNITVPTNTAMSTTDNPIITRGVEFNGWTFIDPNITNIDAFIVSQGPMVSYDGTRLYNAPDGDDLKNQLHIYGSTLSLNTVGGYKGSSGTDVSKCPYFINSCDQKTAFIFDLITLRRYSLEGSGAGTDQLVPTGKGKRSGGLAGVGNVGGCIITYSTSSKKIVSDTCASIPGTIRRITDKDYMVYPLLVEKDTSWMTSQSVMFKND